MDIKTYYSDGLDLRGTKITSLPDGLRVGGTLNLSGTGITSLPDGLRVGGSLDLGGTGIRGSIIGCGRSARTIIAYKNLSDAIVVSLGCFVGDYELCVKAIVFKYGRDKEAEEYIRKVKQAFDYAMGKDNDL